MLWRAAALWCSRRTGIRHRRLRRQLHQRRRQSGRRHRLRLQPHADHRPCASATCATTSSISRTMNPCRTPTTLACPGLNTAQAITGGSPGFFFATLTGGGTQPLYGDGLGIARCARGPRWRQLLDEGLGELSGFARDLTLKTAGALRSSIPGIDLTFNNPPARYDFHRDVVAFAGQAFGKPVACAISREALDDYFGTDSLDRDRRLEAFLKNRSKIEEMARIKYLKWPIEEPDAILIKTSDIPGLESSSKP